MTDQSPPVRWPLVRRRTHEALQDNYESVCDRFDRARELGRKLHADKLALMRENRLLRETVLKILAEGLGVEVNTTSNKENES